MKSSKWFFAPPVGGFIAVLVIGYLAVTRQQWQEVALLVLATVSFVLQVVAAVRSYITAEPNSALAKRIYAVENSK